MLKQPRMYPPRRQKLLQLLYRLKRLLQVLCKLQLLHPGGGAAAAPDGSGNGDGDGDDSQDQPRNDRLRRPIEPFEHALIQELERSAEEGQEDLWQQTVERAEKMNLEERRMEELR
ncbi:hypothetical protein SEUCBS140593_005822 [Sporothrix eucalyptigena]|uniref:Uncharacterized protein n=1 Tax=Sporothrix eucalyptigena TaxID=1812306 RepID=A0ABP0BZQ1_9PEZI